MFLYHYFEKSKGPLLSLSALPSEEAYEIQGNLISDNKTFATQRNERYLPRRRELEKIVHQLFVEKSGKPEKETPHYFVIGECPCQDKGYSHCGECSDIPCEQLRQYSYDDPEHGDNPPGARIEVCKAWKNKLAITVERFGFVD
jgi:hypothetical protein